MARADDVDIHELVLEDCDSRLVVFMWQMEGTNLLESNSNPAQGNQCHHLNVCNV